MTLEMKDIPATHTTEISRWILSHGALAQGPPKKEDPAPPPAPYFRKKTEVEPVEDSHFDGTSVEYERSRMRQEILDYLAEDSPKYGLLIRGTPGIGKSFAGAMAAHTVASQGKKVGYFAPRHSFYGDMLKAAEDQGYDINEWYEWMPRKTTQNPIALENTCLHAGPISQWMNAGYKGHEFCQKVCGHAYMNNECVYHDQKRRKQNIFFLQHNHWVLGHPLASKMELVIGDESPLGSFPDSVFVPPKQIWNNEMPTEPIFDLMKSVLELSEMCKDDADSGNDSEANFVGEDLIRFLGLERIIDVLGGYNALPADLLQSPDIKDAKEVDDIQQNYIPLLVPMLLREALAVQEADENGEEPSFPHRIRVDQHGITMLSRKYVADAYPEHVIWFDGTGDKELYEQMFGREFKEIKIAPRFKGKVVQITDRLNNKSALVETTNTLDMEGKPLIRATSKAAQAKLVVDEIKRRHEKVAVISFKALSDMKAFGETEMMHFYANRGENKLSDEGFDAVCIVGAPQPSVDEIHATAKAVWFDDMKVFDNTWTQTERTYAYTEKDEETGKEKSYSYPVSEFADTRLNTILYQMREAEIEQAAHRVRILHRKATVYMMTNIPIDEMPPDEVLSTRDLIGSPEGIDPYAWSKFNGLVEDSLEVGGHLSARDVSISLGCAVNTAKKYINVKSQEEGFDLSLSRSGRSGHMASSITRVPIVKKMSADAESDAGAVSSATPAGAQFSIQSNQIAVDSVIKLTDTSGSAVCHWYLSENDGPSLLISSKKTHLYEVPAARKIEFVLRTTDLRGRIVKESTPVVFIADPHDGRWPVSLSMVEHDPGSGEEESTIGVHSESQPEEERQGSRYAI